MCNSLEVGADLMLLELLRLMVVIEPRSINLLVDVLRAIVETCICDAQLVAHVVRVDHVRVLLAAILAMLSKAASKSPSLIRVCIWCQLPESRLHY